MYANGLLDSAKTGHIEPAIDQLLKRLMAVIKARGARIEFRLD